MHWMISRADVARYSSGVVGEKLNAFESVSTKTGITLVRRLLSWSFIPGIGENGLTATLTTTPLELFGSVARIIS